MKLWLAELTGYQVGGGETVFRFASAPFTTGPADTPPHAWYDPRIKSPALFRQDCFDGGGAGGAAKVSYGELVLVNTDGGLDHLLGYAFDGRKITIRCGAAGGVYPAGYPVYIEALIEQFTFDLKEISVRLRGPEQLLAKPLQTHLYGGPAGGWLEGNSSLEGKPKPLAYGVVKNAALPMVNSQYNVYQVNDGPVADVPFVYEKGARLERAYTAISTWTDSAPIPILSYSGSVDVCRDPATGYLYYCGYNIYVVDPVTDTLVKTIFAATPIKACAIFPERPGSLFCAVYLGPYSGGLHEYDLSNMDALPVATGLPYGVVPVLFGYTTSLVVQQGSIVIPCNNRNTNPDKSCFAFYNLTTDILTTSAVDNTVKWLSSTVVGDALWLGVASTVMAVFGVIKLVDLNIVKSIFLDTDSPGYWMLVTPDETSVVMMGARLETFNLSDGSLIASMTSPTSYQLLARTWLPTTPPSFLLSSGGGSPQVTKLYLAETLHSVDLGVTSTNMMPIWSDETSTVVVDSYDATTGRFFRHLALGAITSDDYANESAMGVAPAAGYYRVCPSLGYVRLGSVPVGVVTADIDAETTVLIGGGALGGGDPVPVTNTAAPLLYAILDKAGITAEHINEADLTELDTIAPAILGLWLPDTITAAAALDLVSITVGAWWSFSSMGLFRVKRLDAPSEFMVTKLLDPAAILTLKRETLTTEGRGLPVKKVSLNHTRNWTVQDASSLAGIVTGPRKIWLSHDYRTVVAADATRATTHLLAQETTISTLYLDKAAAQTEADRLLVLHGERDKYILTIVIPEPADHPVLGEVVSLSYPRYGMATGKLLVVIGVQVDAAKNRLELALWG